MMYHHSLVGRLGPSDTSTLNFAPNTQVTEIQYLDKYGHLSFGLGQVLQQLQKIDLYPSERALDLALVATLLTAADTRISRTTESQDRWTREVALFIPVAEPVLWTEIKPLLTKILVFLTGDHWELHFRSRPSGLEQLAPAPSLQLSSPPSCVCLFSGGLDSFIGVIDLLAQDQKPLLVSHYGDGVTSVHQTECAEALKQMFPSIYQHWVQARAVFPSGIVQGSKSENTLRGRSFLFFAYAVLAASSIKTGAGIYVPENGLISLNVPLDPLRLGSLSTRTTHPYYMACWNQLLAHLEIPTYLNNPYRHKTKGEMVAECQKQAFLAQYAEKTMSCSSPAKARWQRKKPMHCGYCVPCLIRRAAMAVGLGADNTPYGIPSLRAQILNTNKAEGEHVRSFLFACQRLKARPELAQIRIHEPGPLIDYMGELDQYADVYLRGMLEVDGYLQGVVARPL